MALLRLGISTGKSTATLARDYQRTLGTKSATVQSMADFLMSIVSGTEQYPSVTSQVYATTNFATGTLTTTSAVATNTFTINGVTFTGIASGATGNQFNIGGSDAVTATNIAAAINGSVTALVSGYVTASSTGATSVVTITSAFVGPAGNQTTIASGQGTIVASGARLTGGTIDSGVKVYTF